MSLEVAERIRQQIGNRAFQMLGARNFMGSDKENFLEFKIGRNGKGVTHIRVTLDASDTYTVTAYEIRRRKGVPDAKILESQADVYSANLCRVIESLTEMRTSL